ncbi:MAG: pseudouridine-5'-phosphate glycosidase [Bacteroidota bacterium]
MHSLVDLAPEVAEALQNGQAVVALESTIIAHGMPYPENLETAQRLEQLIREGGAVPATIAILGGRIKVGLEEEDLLFLAQSPEVVKASRRDLGWLLSTRQHAATTVAATMIGAKLAGIRMFATGGIGGVHRKAQETFDISADLQELARTPVGVVSAGVKSILDIPLTLEYLETMGVPVVGVGTREFPAFYTRESGSQAPFALSSSAEIAAMMHTHWQLELGSGILIANPIPEAFSMPAAEIEAVIETALQEAEERQITGKEVTPFLLNRIKELTAGNSLFSNIRLVENNARLAAEIAVALAKLS